MDCITRQRCLAAVGAVAVLLAAAAPVLSNSAASTTTYGVSNWLLFPGSTSSMGLFLALAVPLDLVNQDVTLSYNFEGNYALPGNVTQLQEYMDEFGYKRSQRGHGGRHARDTMGTLRDFSRSHAYAMIESSISRSGKLPGRACLLRAVCEAAEWPMEEGLLGGVLHVLLTPSASKDPDVSPDYHAAERYGRRNADCSLRYKHCPISLLGLLTEQ